MDNDVVPDTGINSLEIFSITGQITGYQIKLNAISGSLKINNGGLRR